MHSWHATLCASFTHHRLCRTLGVSLAYATSAGSTFATCQERYTPVKSMIRVRHFCWPWGWAGRPFCLSVLSMPSVNNSVHAIAGATGAGCSARHL